MNGIDNTLDILNLQFTGSDQESQLLVFHVDGEEFGVDVLLVQEIIRFLHPTKIPNAPKAVIGVINFRGEIIPLIDLRQRFNLLQREHDEFTVIVVVEFSGKTVGLVVDQVSDIVNMPNEHTQLTPEFSHDEKTAYLRGLGKLGDRLILLLAVEKIMNLQELMALEEPMGEVVTGNES